MVLWERYLTYGILASRVNGRGMTAERQARVRKDGPPKSGTEPAWPRSAATIAAVARPEVRTRSEDVPSSAQWPDRNSPSRGVRCARRLLAVGADVFPCPVGPCGRQARHGGQVSALRSQRGIHDGGNADPDSAGTRRLDVGPGLIVVPRREDEVLVRQSHLNGIGVQHSVERERGR